MLGPSSSLLTLGQILGNRYRIVGLLGRGGMGEVWQAYDLKLQVDVALKSIRAERFPGEQGIELLRREVRAAREVMSPNVCRIFDLVDEDGREFVSMEFIDGQTLLQILRDRGPLDLQEATRIASQFLAGLEAIHQAGLVHRDVKPENIMVTRTGRVVLMDFGVAKGVAEGHRGTIAGTPAYMAPEQMRGEALDPRADIFAAGVVLAEMSAPQGVKDLDSRESVWALVRQAPPTLPEGPWREVLERAVAPDRGRRYPSARALARALEEVTLRVEGAEDKRPYPGLQSFTEADAEFFFGREVEVEAVWKKLQRANLLAIIGPSGAGKTSFVQAGLLPAKPTGWEHVLLRPGASPFVALTRALAPELAADKQALDQLLQIEDTEQVLAGVSSWRSRHHQVLIVVDQFEELFTLCPPEVQKTFADLLGRLAAEADVHVLLVMRDDFLFRCHEHPALAPVSSDLTMLGPPTGNSLRRALVQPALLCGYRLEDESLADAMLGAIEGERGALPLLAFAAARLWEHRDREKGLLTREAYERIGGVSGALAQHAEATLERIGADRLPLVRELFRNLVTAEGTRAIQEVDDLLSVFPDREAAGDILRQLVDARLLTSFEVPETREGIPEHHRVEIVHESLLTAWPRLVHWQTQDTEGAQLRDQLRQAARLWKERQESDDLLWTGTAYKEFALWRERYPGGLTETEEAFGKAMSARAQRDRRRRRIVLGAVFAMLLSVIAVIGWYGHKQKLGRQSAEAGKLAALGHEELAGNPSGALAYAIAALETSDEPTTRRFALEALSGGPTGFLMTADVGGVTSFDFSPDGHRLAVNGWDGVRLFHDDGSPSLVFESFHAPRMRLGPQFTPDGDRVLWADATVGDLSLIRIWSASQGKEVQTIKLEGPTLPIQRGNRLFLRTTLTREPGAPVVLRTSALDGGDRTVVARYTPTGWGGYDIDSSGQRMVYTKDRGVYLSPLKDLEGGRAQLVGEHPIKTGQVAFDLAGEQIASADTSGEIRIWSVGGDGMTPLRTLQGMHPVRNLRFAPAGNLLAAVCGPQSKIHLWDFRGPRNAEPITLRMAGENQLAGFPPQLRFDPEGRWIAAGYLANIVLWPIPSPNRFVLPGDGASFTPNGELVVYSGANFATRLRVQNLLGGPPRDLWKAQPGIGAVGYFDPSGNYLGMATESGAYLMSLADGAIRQMPMDTLSGSFGLMTFSPQGDRIAMSFSGKPIPSILIWDRESNTVRVLEQSRGISVTSLAFLKDGRLFSGDDAGTLRQWDLENGSSTVVYRSALPTIWDLSPAQDARFLLMLAGSSTFDQAYRGVLSLLDLKTFTSRALSSHGGKVEWVALDAARQFVVTASTDGAIRVGQGFDEEPHMLICPEVLGVSISPDGEWIAAWPATSAGTDWSKTGLLLFRRPEGRPLHTLPHDELLSRLRGRTNLQVVSDKTSPTGYRLDKGPFRGWEDVPAW